MKETVTARASEGGARPDRASEVRIDRHHLDTLTRKAKAHDAYVWATQRMADKRREVASRVPDGTDPTVPYSDIVRHTYYRAGYNDALLDFSRLVAEAPPIE